MDPGFEIEEYGGGGGGGVYYNVNIGVRGKNLVHFSSPQPHLGTLDIAWNDTNQSSIALGIIGASRQ